MKVKLHGGAEGKLLLEGVLAAGTTLDDLVLAFNSRYWRIDDARGRALVCPSGTLGVPEEEPSEEGGPGT